MSRREAKQIAKKWLRKRPVSEYGKSGDADYLGWWVYVTSDGKIVHMEKKED